jgi:hypothetical protein
MPGSDAVDGSRPTSEPATGSEEESMDQLTIGLDLGKSVFQVRCVVRERL